MGHTGPPFANALLKNGKKKPEATAPGKSSNGDPWENRTPVIAVKGRCLNRLTNGPRFGK
jgi:hypothetical protein